MENHNSTDLLLKVIAEGKSIREENEINYDLIKYSKQINEGIQKLMNPQKICKFLEANKENCINNKILALNGAKAKMYQRAIDETIIPLLDFWMKKLAAEEVVETNSKNEVIKQVTVEIELSTSQESNSYITTKPSDVFQQIDCNASKKVILAYFLILAKEKNSKGEYYMKKEDVVELVNNLFSVFGKSGSQKYYPINLPKKATLIYFMHCFYLKFDNLESQNKMKYVQFLINCFEEFKNDNPDILSSNMSQSKKPTNSKNIIPIEKYFPKDQSKKTKKNI
jgi:hypothetical protein